MKRLITFLVMASTSLTGASVFAQTELPTDAPDANATISAYEYSMTETTADGKEIYKEGRMISSTDLKKDLFIGINVYGLKLGVQYNKK